MIVTVYLPLLATLPLAWLAPMLGRRCAPAVAARLLTFLAGLAALVTLGALGLLMIGATLRRPELSREVATQIADGDSVPAWLGALASVGLAAGLIRLGRILARQRHAAQALHHAIAAHTPGSDQELVVVPDSACHAFAVPGRCGGRGRIVVSTAMLRALDASERRALLAHERAHLRHRHHRHALLLAAAQAVNPLLARLRAEGEFQIERWADEHSAHTTSRPIAARSLAAAALHPGDGRDATSGWTGALAYLRHRVTDRVAALSATAPTTTWAATTPALLVAVAATAALADAAGASIRLLELLYR